MEVYGNWMIGVVEVDFGKQGFMVFLCDEIDCVVYL